MEPIFNNSQVIETLPHRPPFLFVDTIERVTIPESGDKGSITSINIKNFIGAEVEGSFKVQEDLEILAGHFPGRPILPGVIQVEMSAQICPFIFIKAFGFDSSMYDLEVALLGVDKTRFRKLIKPGMNLRLFGKLIKARGIFHTYQCSVHCEGELLSESEVFASLSFVKKESSNGE